MTEPDADPTGRQLFSDVHRLLLRLAGQLPDDLLTHLRGLLGGGDLVQLPDTLAASAAHLGVPLTPAEVVLLRRVLVTLDASGGEPALLAQVPVVEEPPIVGYRFAPAAPAVLAAADGRVPARLDLTGGDPDDLTALPADLAHLADLADDLTDPADDRAVDSVSRHAGVTGIWRAWRSAPTDPSTARAVYVVEVTPDVPAWEVTVDTQRALAGEGDPAPQVEVCWTGELPPYQSAAWAGSALLWAREDGRVRLVPTPGFDPSGRAELSVQDRAEVLARLRDGVPVPGTRNRTTDAVEPTRGAVVPSTWRTDGRWVWPEGVAYYLETYNLAPPRGLVEHLLTAAGPTAVDGVRLFRAMAAVASTA